MEFSNLMLLYTVPLYRKPSPFHYAQQLRDFLGDLLDPDKPGYAALLPAMPGSGDGPDWLEGEKAVTWVSEAFTHCWKPGGWPGQRAACPIRSNLRPLI